MRLQKSTIASGGKPRRRIPDNVGILGSSHPDTTPLYEGGASVLLEFDAGFDAAAALTDVREGVDLAKSNLPAAADDPEIHEVKGSLFGPLFGALSFLFLEEALSLITIT